MTGFDYISMMRELEKLPQMFSVEIFAQSILGKDIPIVRFGAGESAVLYVGAHHGSESITAALLTDFLSDAARHPKDRKTVGGVSWEYLLSHRKFFVIPMLNPDGVEYAIHGPDSENPLYERVLAMNGGNDFAHWQANARGVDLNHNYDAGFYEYKQLERERGIWNGAPTGFSGEYPESEPETAALARFLRASRNTLKGVLTLHTQGEEIFCGKVGAAYDKTAAICRQLERSTGYRRFEPSGSAAFGGLSDWCLATLHLPAFTLECGKGQNPLPMNLRGAIYERLRSAFFSFPLWL